MRPLLVGGLLLCGPGGFLASPALGGDEAAWQANGIQREGASPQRCGQRAQVVEWLEGTYAEGVLGTGLTRRGYVLEVFVAPEARTWTFMMTRPDGISCLVAAGSAWEGALPDVLPQDDDGV